MFWGEKKPDKRLRHEQSPPTTLSVDVLTDEFRMTNKRLGGLVLAPVPDLVAIEEAYQDLGELGTKLNIARALQPRIPADQLPPPDNPLQTS